MAFSDLSHEQKYSHAILIVFAISCKYFNCRTLHFRVYKNINIVLLTFVMETWLLSYYVQVEGSYMSSLLKQLSTDHISVSKGPL